jgi:cell wall-associated protease
MAKSKSSLGLFKLFFVMVLVCPVFFPGSVWAQEGKVEKEFYDTQKGRKSIILQLDTVGIVVRKDVDRKTVIKFADSVGAKIKKSYRDGLYILQYSKPRSRKGLVKLTSELSNKGKQIIIQSGLVLSVPGSKTPVIATNEFIVQFKAGVKLEKVKKINKKNRVKIIAENPFVKGQYLLTVTKGSEVDVLKMAQLYHKNPQTVVAYPNFINVFEDRDTIPGDTFFGNQWHHRNTGQSGGLVDADADTSMAWDITQGVPGIVIAVLENGGFDVNHPDLTPNLWNNPGEIPANGVDDDGNTFVDDTIGWDFGGCTLAGGLPCGDANPAPLVNEDHGTAVAGVAVARGNNGLGVVGSCPNCSLMLLRTGYISSDFAKSLAFGYAQQNAQVISNSWGGGGATPNTVTAINNATAAGVIVLFAAGNTTADVCTGVGADPRVSLGGVIAVSSASNQDRKVVFAAVGQCIDILAPSHRGYQTTDPYVGTLNVTTTDRTGIVGYNNTNLVGNCPSTEPATPPANNRDYTNCFGGTSSATPLTAGIVGLMLSVDNGLTRQEAQNLLQDTADRVEPGVGAYSDVNGFSAPATGSPTHSWGRVNAYEAVRIAAPTATGGTGGVDIFVRDNRLDWGNTERPSNTLFSSPRNTIGHWKSMDIKVDKPPYQVAPTAATFDAFVDEKPSATAGEVNRVYVRARNRGPDTASTVNIKLHWTQFGTALPPLPPDYWTAFPNNSGDPTSQWNPLNCSSGGSFCTINNLAYSGASVAGTPGDVAQIVRFNFPAPTIDPALSNHFCLLAMVDSPQDPISSDSKSIFVVDSITPTDNNVTHRNYRDLESDASDTFKNTFLVRNPSFKTVESVLRVKAPKGWKVKMEPFANGKSFRLKPREERKTTVTVFPPRPGLTGEVEVIQQTKIGKNLVIGGLTLGFSPKKVATGSGSVALNGLALVSSQQSGRVGYLSDGTGFPTTAGDTFSFAPIQFLNGAIIKKLRCVVRDNTKTGYIQINLVRGPINVTDPVVPSQLIASASTFPAQASTSFREVTGTPNATRATVNNDRYGYFFRVDFLDNPGTAGSDVLLKLRGCTVEF